MKMSHFDTGNVVVAVGCCSSVSHSLRVVDAHEKSARRRRRREKLLFYASEFYFAMVINHELQQLFCSHLPVLEMAKMRRIER